MSAEHGWRATLGFMSPAVDKFSVGHEFAKFAPPGVSWAETRIPTPPAQDWNLGIYGSLDAMAECVKILGMAGVDAIVQTGVPVAILFGDEARKRFSEQSKVPVILGADAVVDGVKKVGAKKVVVAHPYPDVKFVELHRKFLEDAGIRVLAMENLAKGYNLVYQHHLVSPGSVYKFSKELFRRNTNADALVITGSVIRYTDIIGQMEKDLGVPVITALVASCWKALDLLGIRDEIRGYGRLLETLLH